MINWQQIDNPDRVKVWDPLVRGIHRTLVLTFFLAYVTEDDRANVHVITGYIVAALIVFRLLCGLTWHPSSAISSGLT